MDGQSRVLMVVGAHALDAELMGGPAVIKWTRAGYRAVFVHATRGERGHRTKSPAEYTPQLEREMQVAAERMGASVKWMGYPAGAIPDLDVAADDMANLIRHLRPEVVITHWRGSLHPRHVQTYHNVREGIRRAALRASADGTVPYAVGAVYFGENLEDLDGFVPNAYLNITDVFDQWYAALETYELFRGGVQAFPYREYYRTSSIVRGIEAGYPMAKAFMLDAFRVDDLTAMPGALPLDPTV
ncbi:MAG: PIG-L deacetylase family protein [Bacillota bacterium]